MKKIIPSVFKTDAWKKLEKAALKAPKVEIKPRDLNDKEDKKRAKLMEQLINYQFKNNIGGIRTKYFLLQTNLARDYFNKIVWGIEELTKKK